jgi:hypothetical protein
MTRARELVDRIVALRDELNSQKDELATIQDGCTHQFGPVRYAPIPIPKNQEVKRWQRTCSLCELVQSTIHESPTDSADTAPGNRTPEGIPLFTESTYDRRTE